MCRIVIMQGVIVGVYKAVQGSQLTENVNAHRFQLSKSRDPDNMCVCLKADLRDCGGMILDKFIHIQSTSNTVCCKLRLACVCELRI